MFTQENYNKCPKATAKECSFHLYFNIQNRKQARYLSIEELHKYTGCNNTIEYLAMKWNKSLCT